MKNRIILLTIVSSFVSTHLSEHIPCNQESKDHLDWNVVKLSVLGDPSRTYPVNDKDAQSHCHADTSLLSWSKNYTKTCLVTREVETSKHVTNLLTFSMQKVVKKRCRSEGTRKVFINAGKCGNAVKSETIKCFNQYSMESQQINRSKKTLISNEKHLLPLLCCAYHKFHDCTVEAYNKPSVANVCTNKANVELEAYIQESMYDVIQYLCGDYQGSNDKCDHLNNRYKDVFRTVRLKSVPISPLGPSNEVFDSIPPL